MPVGIKSHIGLAKEITFGTPVAASKYVPFITESIAANVEQVLSNANRGIYEESPSYNGSKTYSGDIVFDGHPNILGDFFRSALGAPVTSQPDAAGSPTAYKHVFTPVQTTFSTDCDLPPYTLEVHRDATQAWQYSGAVVNSLGLQIGTGQKILRASANIIAKGMATLAKTTPSFETTTPFLFDQLGVKIGGVDFNGIEDFNLSIANNLEGILTLNKTREISKIRRNGARQFTMQFTIDFDGSMTEFNNFLSGTEQAMDVTITGPAISGTQKFELKLEMPKMRYSAFPVNVGNPNRITVQVAALAKYDPEATYALRATLTNTQVTY